MDLAERYYFSDFTLNNYSVLLNLALKNYCFCFFTEKYTKKSILLRHDVEFSIPIALKMAKIESDLGIRATYFIHLHSEFYNALEKEVITSIHEILNYGHQIGLHFDTHFWNITAEDQLENSILYDKNTLEFYTGTEIKVFSFHNTTPLTLSCRKKKYGGLLNVYSDYFMNKYGYNSDSLGYWRFERLEDRLIKGEENNLQILIHDGMWQEEILPPRRRVYKVIDSNAERLKSLYDSFLAKIGVKNIDWDEIE